MSSGISSIYPFFVILISLLLKIAHTDVIAVVIPESSTNKASKAISPSMVSSIENITGSAAILVVLIVV